MLTESQERLPMYDYRLFFPQSSIDDQARTRRTLRGEPGPRRVYRLPTGRRDARDTGRR